MTCEGSGQPHNGRTELTLCWDLTYPACNADVWSTDPEQLPTHNQTPNTYYKS